MSHLRSSPWKTSCAKLSAWINSFCITSHLQCGRRGTGRIRGLGALESPKTGVDHAGQIHSLAEESGIIVPLGQWVLDAACRQLRQWDIEAGEAGCGMSMSVNLSCKQFCQHSLVEMIARGLRDNKIKPSRLKLEITESAIVHDPATATSCADSRAGRGFGCGRFRHGLLFFELPATIPGGHPQDRQILHQRHGDSQGKRGNCPLHHRHGP